jgi:hypothetical protein
MTQLVPDFKEFLKLLNEKTVEYLLSGRLKDLADLEHLPKPD